MIWLNEAVEGYFPRYECVYGELLVTPSSPVPMHQLVVSRIFAALLNYVDREQLPFVVLTSPSDVSWSVVAHLELAVEVISPSTKRDDRFSKRHLYQEEGVPLYWILDAEPKFAEVWTPEAHFPTTERERLVWHPAEAPEPLVVSLAELSAGP